MKVVEMMENGVEDGEQRYRVPALNGWDRSRRQPYLPCL